MRMGAAIQKVFVWLSPHDTLGASSLPLTLLVRPWPVFALGLLAVNDHVLKGAGLLPTWLTGKLSDFAGLLYFPLLLVTLLNMAGFVVGKRRVSFASAHRVHLTVACVITGLFFTGVQLLEPVAQFYADSSSFLMFWKSRAQVTVTMDPTDIVALLSLPLAWLLGEREIIFIPPGRLARMRALAEKIGPAALPQDPVALARALDAADLRKKLRDDNEARFDRVLVAFREGLPDEDIDARVDIYRRGLEA